MIDILTRGFLGELGSKILDFYIANAFLINSLILAYALILVLANHARRKIEDAIMNYFTENYDQDFTNKNETWFKKTLERNQPDWEQLGKSTWIPLISRRKSIGLVFKTPKTLKIIFTAEYINSLFQEKGNSDV
jgi:hypothetical protein